MDKRQFPKDDIKIANIYIKAGSTSLITRGYKVNLNRNVAPQYTCQND